MIPLSALARAVLRDYAIRLALYLLPVAAAMLGALHSLGLALVSGGVLALLSACLLVTLEADRDLHAAEDDSRAPVVRERRRS
jgi:hypothetical protein